MDSINERVLDEHVVFVANERKDGMPDMLAMDVTILCRLRDSMHSPLVLRTSLLKAVYGGLPMGEVTSLSFNERSSSRLLSHRCVQVNRQNRLR
jgi:hypothetical protein